MLESPSYSPIDKIIHHLAFGPEFLQSLLMDMEETLYSESWSNIKIEKPIFITSLPRAGTTILLETLFKGSNLATHTYRDMPFILTPVIWRKFSHHFHKTGQSSERAHGDGLIISEDSPEAFEEVLWKRYFENHYHSDGIVLWQKSGKGFNKAFKKHIKQIISINSQQDNNEKLRYVSKNNANIARTNLLKSLAPDAMIVVPFRHPIEHAISLWRQHTNFLEQHTDDKFTLNYMQDIGHYEFGQLHRPIKFPELETHIAGLKPESLDYWIAYWCCAFSYLLQQQNIFFLSYEDYAASGEQAVSRLAETLDLDMSKEEISSAGSLLKPAPEKRQSSFVYNEAKAKKALDLHTQLKGQCLLAN